MKDQNVNELEVKGAIRPFKIGDPVACIKEGNYFQGKIESFEKDGSTKLKIYNSKDTKDLLIPKGEKLEPLYIIDKNEKMVYLKFTFDEVKHALNNTQDVKVNLDQKNNPFFNLMLGNKTDVIPFEKKMEDKMAMTEGKIQIKRGPNGEPYVNGDVKFKEIKLDRSIYGKILDEKQQTQLKETGELGLVTGFKSGGGKEFNLWVSLDTKLNKVVTARENDIYIGKIYGVTTTPEQQNELKEGKGTTILIKNKPYYVKPSAASQSADGLQIYKEEKAKELNLIKESPNSLTEEKKNNKTKGMKL